MVARIDNSRDWVLNTQRSLSRTFVRTHVLLAALTRSWEDGAVCL